MSHFKDLTNKQWAIDSSNSVRTYKAIGIKSTMGKGEEWTYRNKRKISCTLWPNTPAPLIMEVSQEYHQSLLLPDVLWDLLSNYWDSVFNFFTTAIWVPYCYPSLRYCCILYLPNVPILLNYSHWLFRRISSGYSGAVLIWLLCLLCCPMNQLPATFYVIRIRDGVIPQSVWIKGEKERIQQKAFGVWGICWIGQ